MKAITPKEVEEKQADRVFPDFVLSAFNQCILKAFSGGAKIAHVVQDDVVELILQSRPEFSRGDVFTNKWLDVEPVYRKAGWVVSYYKPSIGDCGGAYFRFAEKGDSN